MANSFIEWDKFSHLHAVIDVPAKTVLLEEGKVSRYAYFIKKGSVRTCFNNKGQDITVQFFFENEGVSSIESFRNGLPSMFSIETIEASTLFKMSKQQFLEIMESNPAYKPMMEEVLFQRMVHYSKLFLSRIKDNPEERYLDLLTNQPFLLQRVPLQYIASYLGITPVSLSRIRNKVHR